MKPVQFPKQKPDDYPDASKLPRTPKTDDDANTQPASQDGKQAPPSRMHRNRPQAQFELDPTGCG